MCLQNHPRKYIFSTVVILLQCSICFGKDMDGREDDVPCFRRCSSRKFDGSTAGIIIGVVAVCTVLAIVIWRCCRPRCRSRDNDPESGPQPFANCHMPRQVNDVHQQPTGPSWNISRSYSTSSDESSPPYPIQGNGNHFNSGLNDAFMINSSGNPNKLALKEELPPSYGEVTALVSVSTTQPDNVAQSKSGSADPS